MEPENTGIPENLNFSGQGDFGGPTPEYLETKALFCSTIFGYLKKCPG